TTLRPSRFDAYGTPTGERSDPMAQVIDGLSKQIERLGARLDEVESRTAGARRAVGAAGAEAGDRIEEERASCNEN
ncbi:MAG: hypothetical protein V3T29_02950, partial [Alphaproteobacteria bacterium]